MPSAGRDPRSIITEDAFRIDPALLGTPLASHWRRGAAMAVDGLLVALLANAPSVLFGVVAALVLFRASAPSVQQGYLRRSMRLMLRTWGAVLLFTTVLVTWSQLDDVGDSWFGDDEPQVASARGSVPGAGAISGLQGLALGADIIQLSRADDEAEARALAGAVVHSMRAQGMSDTDATEALLGIRSESDQPWMVPLVDSIVGTLAPERVEQHLPPDSLAVALSSALASGDSAGAARSREALAAVLSADRVEELQDQLQAAEARGESLEQRLEQQENRSSVMRMARSVADDLGLGFGWSGLYFTGFLALWGGATPGKRLLGLRVIRLDGKPLGWWNSFERFGGYAAAFATGLLGFLQILWDRNRQGIHDKIAETVVVRE